VNGIAHLIRPQPALANSAQGDKARLPVHLSYSKTLRPSFISHTPDTNYGLLEAVRFCRHSWNCLTMQPGLRVGNLTPAQSPREQAIHKRQLQFRVFANGAKNANIRTSLATRSIRRAAALP